MKNIFITILFGLLLISCEQKTTNMQSLSPDQIKANLQKAIPDLPKDLTFKKSSINGLYEVTVGRKVFYATTDGNYLIFGNIINVNTKQNITEGRIQELSKIDFSKLPLDLAIKIVNGNGSKKLVVFSDPECPYCQMFEKQIAANLADTTIYVFMFPLSIHPKAKTETVKIWCSSNRAATWINWMRNKKALPNNMNCDTKGLDVIYKIATDVVQVEGTPTIILENGQILPGMLPADQLITLMNDAAVKDNGKNNTSLSK